MIVEGFEVGILRAFLQRDLMDGEFWFGLERKFWLKKD